MSNNKLNKFNKLVSQEKSGWLNKAKWRKDNEEWLDISFKIAVKVMSALKENKAKGEYPKNQKELADALDCTPQYVSKLLKGQERLGIDTITKVGKIIGVKLIEVPEVVVSTDCATIEKIELPHLSLPLINEELVFSSYDFNHLMSGGNNMVSNYNELLEEATYIRRNGNHLKVA